MVLTGANLALVLLAAELRAQPVGEVHVDAHVAEEEWLLDRWQTEGTLGMSVGRALLLAGGAALEELDALEAELEVVLADVERQVRPRHSAQRKARTVFRHLHRHVLRRYDLYAQPVDLLRGGRYNCVTASTLYFLAAERVGVPVELRVTPVHVYAVVDPGGASIRVEMTAPEAGFGYGESRDATIRLILNQKLVTEEELRELGEEEIYRMFTEESQPVAPAQLVGVVYHNLGFWATQEGDYAAAIEALTKALAFGVDVVDTRTVFMFATLSALLSATDADAVLPLLRHSLEVMSGDPEFGVAILPGFLVIASQLTEEGRFDAVVELIDEAHHHFGEDDEVATRLTRMSALLHHDWARSLSSRGMTEEAVEKSERALALWPDSRTIFELHVQARADLAVKRARESRWEEAIQILETLDVGLDEFPVVAEVAGTVAHFIVLESRANATLEALRATHGLLGRLAELGPEEPLINRALAWVLHEFAMERVRQGAYDAAERYVLEALEHAPDVDYLQESLELIRRRR